MNIIQNAYEIPGLYYIENYLNQLEINTVMNKINQIKFEPISKAMNSRNGSSLWLFLCL